MYERNYHSKVLQTDKNQGKKSSFPWKRLIISVAIIAVFASVFFLIRAPRFQVQTVSVVGTNVEDPDEVSQFVMSMLEGKYLWVLPKTSIVLVSTEHIAASITRGYPRFKSVVVDRDSMNALTVTIVEYPGVYLWCDTLDVCSFMDETGTVFADAPYFSGSAYLKLFVGERQPYPFRPISGAQMDLVALIKERLEAIDIAPVSFSFDSERKLSVKFLRYGTHATILFDPTNDNTVALETLYGGLRIEPMSKLYADRTQVLEYLDVRFGNKLIYKFR